MVNYVNLGETTSKGEKNKQIRTILDIKKRV